MVLCPSQFPVPQSEGRHTSSVVSLELFCTLLEIHLPGVHAMCTEIIQTGQKIAHIYRSFKTRL